MAKKEKPEVGGVPAVMSDAWLAEVDPNASILDVLAPKDREESVKKSLECIPEPEFPIVVLKHQGMEAYSFGGDPPDLQSEFSAIIISHKPRRAMWLLRPEESGGSAPPDCVSSDGVTGYNNGGLVEYGIEREMLCSGCPFNRFTEDEKTGGMKKRCQEKHLVYHFTPGQMIPSMTPFSPTSLKPVRGYLVKLGQRDISPEMVWTKFSVKAGKARYGGHSYSIAHLTMDRPCKVTEYAEAIKMQKTYEPAMEKRGIRAEEAFTSEGGLQSSASSDAGGDGVVPF